MADEKPVPTPAAPTAAEIVTARQLVAEADAREAAAAQAEREKIIMPLKDFLTAIFGHYTNIASLKEDFAANKEVSLHLNAVSTGIEGLVQYTGFVPENK